MANEAYTAGVSVLLVHVEALVGWERTSPRIGIALDVVEARGIMIVDDLGEAIGNVGSVCWAGGYCHRTCYGLLLFCFSYWLSAGEVSVQELRVKFSEGGGRTRCESQAFSMSGESAERHWP